jgi:hypothetical protein
MATLTPEKTIVTGGYISSPGSGSLAEQFGAGATAAYQSSTASDPGLKHSTE